MLRTQLEASWATRGRAGSSVGGWEQSDELLGLSDSQTAFVIEMQSQNRRAANKSRFAEPVRLTWRLSGIAANATSRGLLDASSGASNDVQPQRCRGAIRRVGVYDTLVPMTWAGKETR